MELPGDRIGSPTSRRRPPRRLPRGSATDVVLVTKPLNFDWPLGVNAIDILLWENDGPSSTDAECNRGHSVGSYSQHGVVARRRLRGGWVE